MIRRYQVFQVDAFTDIPFGGNPAGVVPQAEGLTDQEMQLIAREMNVSETAFVQAGQHPGLYQVRFFTPTDEVDLCGHATIAAFWVLDTLGFVTDSSDCVRLKQETPAGTLDVALLRKNNAIHQVMMTQVPPKRLATIPWELELLGILGLEESQVDPSLPLPQVVTTGLPDLIVPLASREQLWGLQPDLPRLAAYCRARDIISVHCFTRDVIQSDFAAHCRDFSPAVGVPEEAATGTASGATAAYMVWNQMVPTPTEGSLTLMLEQGHILHRPSSIIAEIDVSHDIPEQVRVGGQARIVLEGNLILDESRQHGCKNN